MHKDTRKEVLSGTDSDILYLNKSVYKSGTAWIKHDALKSSENLRMPEFICLHDMIHVSKTQTKLSVPPITPASPTLKTCLVTTLLLDDVHLPIRLYVKNFIDLV